MNQLQTDRAVTDGIEGMRQKIQKALGQIYAPYDTAAGRQLREQFIANVAPLIMQKIDPATRAQLMYRMSEDKVRRAEKILGIQYPEPWEVAKNFREADERYYEPPYYQGEPGDPQLAAMFREADQESMPTFNTNATLDTSQVEDRRKK